MKNTLYIFLFAIAMLCAPRAAALDLDGYASNSKLAQGRWVKVSVPASGTYMITNAQLRQWGFSDPSQVRIYGYGGARIPDALTQKNYIDDLPLVQFESVDNGIVFYGVGPENWVASSKDAFVNNSNIYATVGYYFLSDTGEEARPITKQGNGNAGEKPARTYVDRFQYEYDRVSPGESGYLLVGESFKAQSTRKFSFDFPADSLTMECAIVSDSPVPAPVDYIVNGKKVEQDAPDLLPETKSSTYQHGSHSVFSHKLWPKSDKFELAISIPTAPGMKDCWLDYISLSAVRELALPAEEHLSFSIDVPSAVLKGDALSGLILWDVTEPLAITAVDYSSQGTNATWTSDYTKTRSYAAWTPSAKLPSPTFVGSVANQNIHGMDCVDMVIFTLPDLASQAERIANLHRTATHPLSVSILDVNQVYNEFSSGTADVSALRKCLKMLYDRGMARDSSAIVKYALLLGRATYDHRKLTSQFDTNPHGIIPVWMGGTRNTQLSDNTAYGTDDFIAMLDDNSGSSLGRDTLRVAVGRIPAKTLSEAKNAADKLTQYVQKNRHGTWRNSFLFLADDGNNNEHIMQTEAMIAEMLATPKMQNFISKVYVDAYDIIAGSCEGGRHDMYRMLDEGVLWWNFCGHANNHSWTGENMLNYNDINNLYLNRVPILLAATCDFLRWDSNTLSGGEILYHERYGGSVATISATRPVYISENGYFTRAIGRSINKRNEAGALPRIGDIYRMAKNDIRDNKNRPVATTNRLRYVLMGDPAMSLAMPDNIVRIDSIGDAQLTVDAQLTLMALQRTTITGCVTDAFGELIPDFNGTVEIAIYDAEKSITTKGRGDDNSPTTFEHHGDKLFAGSAPVVNGRFKVNVAMPGEVADNFRPATINMYAYSSDGAEGAVGVNSDFYVYGLDETVPNDTVAPVIESLVLNHSSFKSGDVVNESPMVLAQIRDDVGINLSSAGVGHQMSITIDGNRHLTDVAQYFTPASDGTPSGTINYPMEGLSDGNHTLRLRVWDTNGNSCTNEIDFFVREGLAPKIYDIFTDANPASTEANFFITHNRPDGELEVKVSVFTLGGHKVWESTSRGRSDMFTTAPLTWDLCDTAGRRVQRGIYVYRASISADNGLTYETGSKKLAVTAE